MRGSPHEAGDPPAGVPSGEGAGTRRPLAALVGVRRETIGRLEKGQYNPSLKLAMDLARVFEVPVETLFAFREEE